MDKKKLLLTLAGWAMLAAVAYNQLFHDISIPETFKGVGRLIIGILLLGALWVGYSKLIEYVHDKDPSGVTGNIITLLLAAFAALLFFT